MLGFSLEKILFIFPVCNFPLICQCRIYANVYWHQAFIAKWGSLWALLIQGWENYRSACLVERGVIYLFAPGIWTEFKIFVKAKRLPFVEGCKACDQLKPSPLLFNHHLCSFPSPVVSWDIVIGYGFTLRHKIQDLQRADINCADIFVLFLRTLYSS